MSMLLQHLPQANTARNDCSIMAAFLWQVSILCGDLNKDLARWQYSSLKISGQTCVYSQAFQPLCHVATHAANKQTSGLLQLFALCGDPSSKRKSDSAKASWYSGQQVQRFGRDRNGFTDMISDDQQLFRPGRWLM